MSGLTPEIRREILHRACARLLSDHCFGPLVVWEAVCDVADGFDLGERVRHYRGQLRGFVEVYLSLFLPDGSWSFEAAGDPPVLWWSGDRGVLCDFFFCRRSGFESVVAGGSPFCSTLGRRGS